MTAEPILAGNDESILADNSILARNGDPIPANTDPILAALDGIFDTGKKQEIKEGRRIEFFEGKRKLKNGTIKKTGNHYWQWAYKTPDTGKRKRKYGGTTATVPISYQYRRREYETHINS